MKATRRGFFGGMVGAAVAGPSLVKQAAAQALSGSGLTGSALLSGGYGNEASTGVARSHSDWLRERIGKLRSMSADERREEIQRMGFDIDLAEIATLRSVSDRHKIGMLAERRFERQRGQELGRLLRELAGLESRA